MTTADPQPGARVPALVIELYRHAATVAAEIAAASGLHPTDMNALRLLDTAAEGPLPVNALGARLGLSSGAVTALVDRLEAHGLAERVRDATDRRRVLVGLGPAARKIGAEQLRPVGDRLAAAVAVTDQADLAAVERFLTRLLP
jgi:DNA-binding MarR family transcriptional regulator